MHKGIVTDVDLIHFRQILMILLLLRAWCFSYVQYSSGESWTPPFMSDIDLISDFWLIFSANLQLMSLPLLLLPCLCFAEIMQETVIKGIQIQITLYVFIAYILCEHTLWLLKIILKDGGEHIHLACFPFPKLKTLYISFSWKKFHETFWDSSILFLFVLLSVFVLFCFILYALDQEEMLHWVTQADYLALDLSSSFPW